MPRIAAAPSCRPLASALAVTGLVAIAAPASADLPIRVDSDAGGPNGALGLVGESSTQGTLPWIGDDLAAQGWGPLRLYAFPGVRIPAGPPVSPSPPCRRWGAEGFDPRVWIVGLGANDVGFTESSVPKAVALIDSMLDTIGPGREVLWINITHPEPAWQAAWNQALNDVAARRLNLHIFDWASIAAQHPDWLVGDGVHPTPTGYRRRRGSSPRPPSRSCRPTGSRPPSPAPPPPGRPAWTRSTGAGPRHPRPAGGSPPGPPARSICRLRCPRARRRRREPHRRRARRRRLPHGVGLQRGGGVGTARRRRRVVPQLRRRSPRGAATVVGLSPARPSASSPRPPPTSSSMSAAPTRRRRPTLHAAGPPAHPRHPLERCPGGRAVVPVPVPRPRGHAVGRHHEPHGHRRGKPGFLTAFPCGGRCRWSRTSTTGPARAAANLATVKLAANGGSACSPSRRWT